MCQSTLSGVIKIPFIKLHLLTFFQKKVFQPPPVFYLLETSQSRHLSLHSSYNIWAYCIMIYLFTCLSSLKLFEGKDNFLSWYQDKISGITYLVSLIPAKT